MVIGSKCNYEIILYVPIINTYFLFLFLKSCPYKSLILLDTETMYLKNQLVYFYHLTLIKNNFLPNCVDILRVDKYANLYQLNVILYEYICQLPDFYRIFITI